MVSRFIQVIPYDIDETYQVPQVIYEVVAPTTAVIPSTQIQPRIIQIPAQQAPILEIIEPSRKQQRTTIIRQPQTQQIIVQQTPQIEYVDEQRPRRVIQQAEYVDDEEQRPRRVVQQIEYVDEQKPRRIVQQPEYEIVEEIDDRSSSSGSSMEEVVEIVDAPKQSRKRGRKKGKKNKTGAISVKHINSNGEIVENHNRKHYA
jgi:hypothetical protein